MIELISEFIPDFIKSKGWRMWEYRTLHQGMRKRYGFYCAWGFTRVFIDNYSLIEEIKIARKS